MNSAFSAESKTVTVFAREIESQKSPHHLTGTGFFLLSANPIESFAYADCGAGAI